MHGRPRGVAFKGKALTASGAIDGHIQSAKWRGAFPARHAAL